MRPNDARLDDPRVCPSHGRFPGGCCAICAWQFDEPDDNDKIAHLMQFYQVSSLKDLVLMQDRHIERLQAKLPPTRDERPGYVPREG